MDSIIKNSNRLATILDSTNGKNVDTLHYVHLCTLDIIFDSFLSCDLDLQNNPECKLDEYISETMDIIMKRAFQFWLHPDIIFYNSYLGKRLKELTLHIDKITSEGSTTTAETLAFLFLMVATFPEVQQQIYEELYQMYGSSDPEDILITLEDIKEMKYLERVIRETLRLFPPAAFIGRKISEDIEGILTHTPRLFWTRM
ncbi:cytochrome P450 4V2-like [Polistes fuscatus]|uniref:cytochrome P450 4V2-like n=1 Tax=Polistes fuscatus TaxID=30207 RepID=UPI001CA97552|nr:cytochrome P450 4V2-like [Polistes fuscatus]